MSGGYISLFNASTVFSDAELQNALPDFQSQVSGEFNWYWGFDAYLDINGGGTPLVVVDLPGPNDPQGALGYHWIDANYQPYAVIFAGLCQQYGVPVTGVISHELLEMLADQLADTCALYDYGDGYGVIVLQEVCDPVEQNIYYEGPNGNLVSDFATPAWYAPGDPNGPYDFLGVVPALGSWRRADMSPTRSSLCPAGSRRSETRRRSSWPRRRRRFAAAPCLATPGLRCSANWGPNVALPLSLASRYLPPSGASSPPSRPGR